MTRGSAQRWLWVVLLATATGACTSGDASLGHGPRAATALFSRDGSAEFATQIRRDPWPVTFDGYHSIRDRVYVEYYRDFFGNEFQERNTPQRNFRAYSIGASQR